MSRDDFTVPSLRDAAANRQIPDSAVLANVTMGELRAAIAQEGSPVGLDEAWKAAEAALPEGAVLMVGKTIECSYCPGWWATSSGPRDPDTRFPRIVSSETGRPRGEHHDATPVEALNALRAALSDDVSPEPENAK